MNQFVTKYIVADWWPACTMPAKDAGCFIVAAHYELHMMFETFLRGLGSKTVRHSDRGISTDTHIRLGKPRRRRSYWIRWSLQWWGYTPILATWPSELILASIYHQGTTVGCQGVHALGSIRSASAHNCRNSPGRLHVPLLVERDYWLHDLVVAR